MADFNKVHQDALREARRNLEVRKDTPWAIALRSPVLQISSKIEAMEEFVTVIHVKIDRNNKLRPIDQGSVEAYLAWKEKYKDTDDAAFEFPEGI